jgi:hypothetical protein
MLYQHCPRCRLAIRCRASHLVLEHCPRCLGRAGIATVMFASPLNATELRAAERDGQPATGADAERVAGRSARTEREADQSARTAVAQPRDQALRKQAGA